MRLGLIGCGRAAERLYLPALAHVEGVRLAAVCDVSAQRRQEIASRVPGCVAAESMPAMLDATQLDAVAVLTPPELHLDAAQPALARGLAVLIEKPLAATLEQAQAIAEAASAGEAPVMLAFNRRWWTPVRRLADAARGLGGPVEIESVFISDAQQWSPLCGVRDPLDDLASHHLDLLAVVTGQPVAAVAASPDADGGVTIACDLADGSKARVFTAQRAQTVEWMKVRRGGAAFRLDMGSVRVSPATGPVRRGLDFADRVARKLARRPSAMAMSYAHQLDAFRRVVDEAAPVPVGLDAGLQVMRAIAATRRSLEDDGRVVTVEETA